MKLQDLGIYSRPVLFERNNTEYPYSVLGTCFGIKYNNKYMLITAKHVLDNFKDDEVSIPYIAGSKDFLPISEIIRIIEKEETDDTDQFDIAIIKLSEKLFNDNFDPNSFIEIGECFMNESDFSKCIIFGFPEAINDIDYDQNHIKIQRCMLEGSSISQSTYHNNCFTFEPSDSYIKSLNGFSGSPVYGVFPLEEGYQYCLIGMMILEKYFILSKWLISILKNI